MTRSPETLNHVLINPANPKNDLTSSLNPKPSTLNRQP